jgi:hypothetical protein
LSRARKAGCSHGKHRWGFYTLMALSAWCAP